MKKMLTTECEAWARSKATSLCATNKTTAWILRITPSEGAFIAGYRMPHGGLEYPHWSFHVAAVCQGKAYDEVYPDGVPMHQYKRKFQYWDKMVFSLTPFVYRSLSPKR